MVKWFTSWKGKYYDIKFADEYTVYDFGDSFLVAGKKVGAVGPIGYLPDALEMLDSVRVNTRGPKCVFEFSKNSKVFFYLRSESHRKYAEKIEPMVSTGYGDFYFNYYRMLYAVPVKAGLLYYWGSNPGRLEGSMFALETPDGRWYELYTYGIRDWRFETLFDGSLNEILKAWFPDHPPGEIYGVKHVRKGVELIEVYKKSDWRTYYAVRRGRRVKYYNTGRFDLDDILMTLR